MKWVTGNSGKIVALNRQLKEMNINLELFQIDIDLAEVLGSPKQIAIGKAMMARAALSSQLADDEGVMIEDTSLHLFNSDGSQVQDWNPELIKYLIPKLSNYEGYRASWVSHIAICYGDLVRWTVAEQSGVIVKYEPVGHGFDGYFKPDGAAAAYGHNPIGEYSPRVRALLKLISEKDVFIETYDPLFERNWRGGWQ